MFFGAWRSIYFALAIEGWWGGLDSIDCFHISRISDSKEFNQLSSEIAFKTCDSNLKIKEPTKLNYLLFISYITTPKISSWITLKWE